jgi:hypothetical protein
LHRRAGRVNQSGKQTHRQREKPTKGRYKRITQYGFTIGQRKEEREIQTNKSIKLKIIQKQ